MRKFHLTNEEGLNAMVRYVGLRPAAPPTMGIGGKPATFKRYLSAAPTGLHEALVEAHGEDYGQALIDGDSEVDIEAIGQTIENTQVVYVAASGEVMYYPPKTVEVIVLRPTPDEGSLETLVARVSHAHDGIDERGTLALDDLNTGFQVHPSELVACGSSRTNSEQNAEPW